MPLSFDEKLIAEQAGHKLFYYSREGEIHAAVLRKDPNAYATALEEYNKLNPAAFGSVPAPEDVDRCVVDCERALSQNCTSLVDHIKAYSASLFLDRVLSQSLRWEVLLLALEFRAKLAAANPYIIDPATLLGVTVQPGTLHPLLAAKLTNTPEPRTQRDTAVRYPAVLVADEAEIFSWDNVPSSSQRVSPEQIATWKRNPEPAQDLIFVATGNHGKEAFKLISFMTIRKAKVFYVLFVDEMEASGYTSDAFFELLEGAELRSN
ncbi:hypothetical protein BT96DRAFT_919363 [Gymnopus androsaceus JB14]|uniref:Uncharacterized protein n=1 Tax=Gymnopus androsaceus JB14 TaxID=1447944 RepID=A0A6A4HUV5_9AGAR|nr:hypothetical protein BT96DRAFT_919363 [Gymnopus androsaceus JB14]